MSNLKQERIFTIDWLCNNRATCGRTNQTEINTADFPAWVPGRAMVDCPHCGELQAIAFGHLAAEVANITVGSGVEAIVLSSDGITADVTLWAGEHVREILMAAKVEDTHK